MVFLARRYRSHRFIAKNTDRAAFQRALRLLERYPTIFILSFRFIYGIRNISPIAIGLGGVTTLRFFILNAIAAAIWASMFTALGFVFANTFESMLGEIRKIEHVALAVAVIAAVIFAIHYLVRRSLAKSTD